MLEEHGLADYLLENGLLDRESVVGGDFDVRDASRRNLNFKVLRERGPSYFLKQGVGPGSSIDREAAIYRLLRSLPGADPLTQCIPNVVRFDPTRHILILQSSREAETLEEYGRESARIPAWTGSMLGKAIGCLHRVTGGPDRSVDVAEYRAEPPWVFGIHRTTARMFWGASGANVGVFRIIQESGLGPELDALRESWRTECLVHGDLKAGNFLVERSARSVRRSLRIVDWELAGLGDPAWDVGSVLSDYLALWLRYAPMAPEIPVETSLREARLQLDDLVPAIRSFYRAYVMERSLDSASAGDLLGRSIRHAAARLLQTAHEMSRQANQVSTQAVYLVQLSANILRRPAAASRLLGLSDLAEIGPSAP